MLIFSADRENLQLAIGRASAGLSPRPLNPVHAGMLISSTGTGLLRLTAGDGKVVFTSSVDAYIHSGGSAVLPGRMLADISKYFTGDSVSIEASGKSATILAGKSKFTVSASGDYPEWNSPPEPLGKLDAAEFTSCVKYVAGAASIHDPILQAMRIEITDDKLLMVATDHSRMALASPQMTAVTLKGEIRGSSPVLVPAVAMERFSHVTEREVSIGWDDSLAGVYTEGLQVTLPQVSGQFIKGWEMILKDYSPKVTTDAEPLVRAIRVAALAAGPKGTVKLTFGDSLLVEASGDAECLEELEIAGNLEPRALTFNPQYLLDGVRGEKVSFAFTGRALLMECEGFKYLCQPRRS